MDISATPLHYEYVPEAPNTESFRQVLAPHALSGESLDFVKRIARGAEVVSEYSLNSRALYELISIAARIQSEASRRHLSVLQENRQHPAIWVKQCYEGQIIFALTKPLIAWAEDISITRPCCAKIDLPVQLCEVTMAAITGKGSKVWSYDPEKLRAYPMTAEDRELGVHLKIQGARGLFHKGTTALRLAVLSDALRRAKERMRAEVERAEANPFNRHILKPLYPAIAILDASEI